MRIIKKYNEKLMEVPEGYLRDVSGWLYKVFASHLRYSYALLIRASSDLLSNINLYSSMNKDGVFEDELNRRIDIGKRALEILNPIYDKNIYRTIESNKGLRVDFDTSGYKSRYGDIYSRKKFVTLRYRYRGSSGGMYSPKTREMSIYTLRFASSLGSFLRRSITADGYLILEYPIKGPDWQTSLFDVGILKALDYTVNDISGTIEHEFIHFLQDIFFTDKIKDPQYSTNNDDKYYTSPFEVNPQLISSMDAFRRDLHRNGEIATPESMRLFISKDKYFQALQRKDKKLYNKHVGAFYQLLVDRGILK